MNGSTDVLEHILAHDSCNPDIRNRLAGDTPLHIAVRNKWEDHPGMRLYLGALDSGHTVMAVQVMHRSWTDPVPAPPTLLRPNTVLTPCSQLAHFSRPAPTSCAYHGD